MLFSWSAWGCGFLERIQGGHSTHMNHWLLLCKVTIFPFPCSILWKQVPKYRPPSREGEKNWGSLSQISICSSTICWKKQSLNYRGTFVKNQWTRGFPGGAVVESLPANAGDTASSPGLGRSHMPRSTSAREPQLLSLRVWSLCSAIREAATVRGPRTAMKSGPHLPQLEKAIAQKWRPNTAKTKLIN